MKTFNAGIAEIQASKKWLLIDADGLVLGRLASKIAQILRGKNKPIFIPHLDVGDYVVVINADRVRLTGKKIEQKQYFHHTGYPGGARFESLKQVLATKPERVLRNAIKGMLPHNRLGRKLLKKVKIYAGSEHPHQAQRPEMITL